jgi:2,4-didehydro-3-deoxy-L-rhamnonate hydrolase
MRFVRFGSENNEKPGILDEQGKRLDLSEHFKDWDSDFFAQGGPKYIANWLTTSLSSLPLVPDDVRWGPPVRRPGKIVCIGLNYLDHAREASLPIPKEPVLFLKAPNTVVGPYDDIRIPRNSLKTDWEVELAVVIGQKASYLSEPSEAYEHIAVYCILHDVSEREFQFERGGQWTNGKSCDTFSPLGPWLSTPDDVPDVSSLKMRLRVNSATVQDGSTAAMIFGVSHIIHYVSQFMTLEPGDILSTGTPSGVGFGMKPPRYLKAGDIVDLAIERLGTQRQKCISA